MSNWSHRKFRKKMEVAKGQSMKEFLTNASLSLPVVSEICYFCFLFSVLCSIRSLFQKIIPSFAHLLLTQHAGRLTKHKWTRNTLSPGSLGMLGLLDSLPVRQFWNQLHLKVRPAIFDSSEWTSCFGVELLFLFVTTDISLHLQNLRFGCEFKRISIAESPQTCSISQRFQLRLQYASTRTSHKSLKRALKRAFFSFDSGMFHRFLSSLVTAKTASLL